MSFFYHLCLFNKIGEKSRIVSSFEEGGRRRRRRQSAAGRDGPNNVCTHA
jgi:hypothetical protein